MNNYQNPYYMNAYGYQYNPYQNNMTQPINNMQNTAQPTQTSVPQTNQRNNYDFQGNYVKSFEEAKNSPYTDKTMVYLDTENDKIYIKRINEKGTPETNVYLITSPIDDIKVKEEFKNNKSEENLKQEIVKLKKEYDDKISNLQQQIKEIKTTKGGK